MAAKKLAIIDYGSGNLRSVAKAFEHVASAQDEIRVIQDAGALRDATHIVLPGVGAFADCMAGITACPGLREALEREVLQRKKPFLGICVGMQLLFSEGHEHGVHAGLGWIPGQVVPLAPAPGLKIPHMGWNELRIHDRHPLFNGLENGAHAYFVHSYHAQCAPEYVLATVEYGRVVTAAVVKENIMGTQFHPEKSQAAGLAVLRNFMGMG